MIGMDWAIKKPDVFYSENNGANVNYVDENVFHDDIIFVEKGCPRAKLYNLIKNGNRIFQVDPKLILEFKTSLDIEKTDENDAKAIYDFAKIKPEMFIELTEHDKKTIENEIIVKQYSFITKTGTTLKNTAKAFKRQFGFDNQLFLDQINVVEVEKKTFYKKLEIIARPFLPEVEHIKGVGSRLIAEVLFLKHPNNFKDYRQYLMYCGFYKDARKIGKFNRALKNTYYLMTRGIIMAKDPKYSVLYHELKINLRKEHPDKIQENGKIRWNNGHIDAIARNRVATELAKDMWKIYHGHNGEKSGT